MRPLALLLLLLLGACRVQRELTPAAANGPTCTMRVRHAPDCGTRR